jgi:hypothetical protein
MKNKIINSIKLNIKSFETSSKAIDKLGMEMEMEMENKYITETFKF